MLRTDILNTFSMRLVSFWAFVLVAHRVLVFAVCDELMLGIPHGAWWVGVAALLCLLLGILIPSFFPLHLLLKDEDLESENIALTKVS